MGNKKPSGMGIFRPEYPPFESTVEEVQPGEVNQEDVEEVEDVVFTFKGNKEERWFSRREIGIGDKKRPIIGAARATTIPSDQFNLVVNIGRIGALFDNIIYTTPSERLLRSESQRETDPQVP